MTGYTVWDKDTNNVIGWSADRAGAQRTLDGIRAANPDSASDFVLAAADFVHEPDSHATDPDEDSDVPEEDE